MEISKKDLAEVGEAVETLGRLVEQQLQSIQLKLNHLSQSSTETLSVLKGIQKRLPGLETELEELKEKSEEFSYFPQELKELSRSIGKLLCDLQELVNSARESEKS